LIFLFVFGIWFVLHKYSQSLLPPSIFIFFKKI